MSRRSWVADQNAVDEVDRLAIEAERKWGVGRLRLLVPLELRQKFDSQRARLNAAIASADSPRLAEECRRMCNAWRALEKAAEASGAKSRVDWWEIVGDDGIIITVVRTDDEIQRVPNDGFRRSVWSLEEIAKLIATHPEIKAIKAVFGTAYVEQIKRSIADPVPASGGGDMPHEDLDAINWTGRPDFVPPAKGGPGEASAPVQPEEF